MQTGEQAEKSRRRVMRMKGGKARQRVGGEKKRITCSHCVCTASRNKRRGEKKEEKKGVEEMGGRK